MSEQAITVTRQSSRGVNIALWVLQVLLGLSFTGSAIAKFAGGAEAVQLFDDIGAGRWLLYLTATLELVGAIGLFIPRLAGLAALGLVGVMAGAVITDVFIVDRTFVPALSLLVLAALVAFGRRDRTAALFKSRSA